jgi:vancomycin resistance protein YoaR
VTLLNAGSPRRGFLVGFLGTLALGFVLLSAVSIGVSVANAGRIMPGVRVGGVEVGGLDRAAATARLESQLPSLSAGSLEIRIGEETVLVPMAELGRRYDLDVMLNGAFGVARSGDLVADAIARLRVFAVPSSVPSAVTTDGGAAAEAVVGDLVDRFSATASDASISYARGQGFTVEPGVVGMALDADELRAALLAVTAGGAASPAGVSVEPVVTDADVTTREAEVAARQANRIVAEPLTLRAGAESYRLRPAALVALVRFATLPDGTYGPTIDEDGLTDLVKPLARKVRSEPQNASFTWGTGGVTGVVPAVQGRRLDVEASVATIAETLRDRGHAVVRRSIPLAVVASAPALTTRAAEAAAPNMQRLGTGRRTTSPARGTTGTRTSTSRPGTSTARSSPRASGSSSGRASARSPWRAGTAMAEPSSAAAASRTAPWRVGSARPRPRCSTRRCAPGSRSASARTTATTSSAIPWASMPRCSRPRPGRRT